MVWDRFVLGSKTFPGDEATNNGVRRLEEALLDTGLEMGLDGPGEDVGGGLAPSRALDLVVGGTDPKRDVAGEE